MSYYIDKNLENMILKSMVDISDDEAIELYDEVLQEMPPQETLSAASRGKTFGELTYKQLQYIVLGSDGVNAESRANANIVMLNLLLGSKRVNRYLTNESLLNKLRIEVKQAYGNTDNDVCAEEHTVDYTPPSLIGSESKCEEHQWDNPFDASVAVCVLCDVKKADI